MTPGLFFLYGLAFAGSLFVVGLVCLLLALLFGYLRAQSQ